MKTTDTLFETRDELQETINVIKFMGNMLAAWDTDRFAPSTEDMHGFSDICERVESSLKKVDSFLKAEGK